MAKVDDYRLRVGHLIQACNELKRAVLLLGARIPDESGEGIAEKVQDFADSCDAELNEAGYEL